MRITFTTLLLLACCISGCKKEAKDGGDSSPAEPFEDLRDAQGQIDAMIAAAEAQEWPDAGGPVAHRLPYAEGVHMGITQSTNCDGHAGPLEGSIDFNITGGDYESTNGVYAVASAAGTVVGVERSVTGFVDKSYGNLVLLRHPDGTYTIYAHLQYGHVDVEEGDAVCAGQPLGLIGSTGESYGDHLHYEQRDAFNVRANPTFVELSSVPSGCSPCTTNTHESGCYGSENRYVDCLNAGECIALEPSSGQVYEVGVEGTVEWTCTELDGLVRVDVYKGGAACGVALGAGEQPTGSIPFNPPAVLGSCPVDTLDCDWQLGFSDNVDGDPSTLSPMFCIDPGESTTSPVCGCTDGDGDGWYLGVCADTNCVDFTQDGDCNDGNAAVNPGAAEVVCDGVDNDCAGGDDCPICTCTDADGDGWFAGTCTDVNCPANNQDNDCDDGDDLRHPGMPELWDIRDNDCDNDQDEDGRLRLDRYMNDWPNIVTDLDGDGNDETYWDWEHRFDTTTPAGFLPDGKWIEIYPADMCTNPSHAPWDGCTESGGVVSLWGGYAVVALAECIGTEPSGLHVSFYVPEDSAEYATRDADPNYSCSRLGFVVTSVGTCNDLGASCDDLFRVASAPFDGVGVSPGGAYAGGIMWGADPNESPDYPANQPAFSVLATQGW